MFNMEVSLFSLFLLMLHEIYGNVDLPSVITEVLAMEANKSFTCMEDKFSIEYDFIVVGSGPGGSTVANRLSENPNWNVLLLEAGKEESIVLQIPAFTGYAQGTEFDWSYVTEHQAGNFLGFKEKRASWPRGKALGGSSSINYMIYTRGHHEDYNEWAREGNPGWNYDEVLPYFLKSENAQMPDLEGSPYHNKGGYLSVERVGYRSELMNAYLEAGAEMDLPVIDYNDGNLTEGVSPLQATLQRGQRCSASKAFLQSIKCRKNLEISTESRVTKILIDPITKTAYGVEVIKNQLTSTIYSKKEVILSAGALGTPQLLMLSGIGPKTHLIELGIPVIQDLPVGENLLDHALNTALVLSSKLAAGIIESQLTDSNAFSEFITQGKGVYTVPGLVEGLGYVRTKYNKRSKNRPDVELIFCSIGANANVFGFNNDIAQKYFRPIQDQHLLTIWPVLVHSKSRGFMNLKSSNPFDSPKFYFDYFQDEDDLNSLVEGIKFVIEMSQTEAFKKYGVQLYNATLPGCENMTYGSDDYWKCVVRHTTISLNHQSGTCKMGPKEDQSAVVSPELRVHGIKNLRVVDASIMPTLPTAHSAAPTYMIGEKGSDFIKSSWAQKE